jgi:hypothetical protein
LLTIAGLWDEWQDRVSGETLKSCTMIITEPTSLSPRCMTECLSLPQSDPHILMVESTEHGPHFDAPVALNGPSNGCILP